MSLDNLVGTSLERMEANATTIERMVQAAAGDLTDAQVVDISAELRFDAAYKAILQLANAALQAHGYRTLTSRPGHYMTMLQTLGVTLDIDRDTVIVLGALRKQRNVVDYSGDLVSERLVNECCQQATVVQQSMLDWLRQHQPGWLE